MVCVLNVCMCGQECEHALRCLRTVCVPLVTNQNLLVFSANTKGIVCITMTGFFMFANGTHVACIFHFFNMDKSMLVECVLKLWFVVCSPHVRGKLITMCLALTICEPHSMIKMRMCVSGFTNHIFFTELTNLTYIPSIINLTIETPSYNEINFKIKHCDYLAGNYKKI